MVQKLSWISIFAMLWLAIFKILPTNGSYFGFLGIFVLLAFLAGAYAKGEQKNVSKLRIKKVESDDSK